MRPLPLAPFSLLWQDGLSSFQDRDEKLPKIDKHTLLFYVVSKHSTAPTKIGPHLRKQAFSKLELSKNVRIKNVLLN